MAERIADLCERVALGLEVFVAVDLQGHGQARVAEYELGVAGRTWRFLSRLAVVCLRW